MKDDSDEFNEPYLPARYKEVVRRKKQRRLLKKIGMIAVAVIAVIVIYILVSGTLTGSPQPAPAPTPTLTLTPQETPRTTATVATPATTPVPSTTAIPSARFTTIPTGFIPGGLPPTPEPSLTAMAGALKTVTPTSAPKITEQQAKTLARTAFPALPTGEIKVELSTSPEFGRVWEYSLTAGTTIEASGLLDAETGTVVTFNRTIHPGGRPQNPVLTLQNARQIADSTVNSRNTGVLSINMSDGHYIPLAQPGGNVAGTYRFVYNRIIQDYPCDADGFIVSVDAVNGQITEFVQHWQTPDSAFTILEDPVVPKYEAIFTVQTKAKSIYPSSVTSLVIISAERCWKDRHDPEIIPRPSTIPLAWKVVFDDDFIRANGKPPAVGWVDTHSGEIIEMDYQH